MSYTRYIPDQSTRDESNPPDHYGVLGIAATATAAEIRAAYRALAFREHPDRQMGDRTSYQFPMSRMAELNEAYRVLRDRRLRAEFDRARSSGQRTDRPADDDNADALWPVSPAVEHSNFLSPPGPARFPWKGILLAAAVGSAIVVAAAMRVGTGENEPPDGVIESGSCVEVIEPDEVREVLCGEPGERRVESMVPLDRTCPKNLLAYRDRLGLGIVCLVP